MISCIFAYAAGTETQSAAVELSDPMSALFLVKNDDRARSALRAWLTHDPCNARHDNDGAPDPASLPTTPIQRAA